MLALCHREEVGPDFSGVLGVSVGKDKNSSIRRRSANRFPGGFEATVLHRSDGAIQVVLWGATERQAWW
jgi:hypothetical protein